jgi:hypothetical protein
MTENVFEDVTRKLSKSRPPSLIFLVSFNPQRLSRIAIRVFEPRFSSKSVAFEGFLLGSIEKTWRGNEQQEQGILSNTRCVSTTLRTKTVATGPYTVAGQWQVSAQQSSAVQVVCRLTATSDEDFRGRKDVSLCSSLNATEPIITSPSPSF